MNYDYSSAISESVRAEVVSRLAEIEQTENISIILAVESGSRAWGFPSVDSDYDVRFIYLRPRNWYLRINADQAKDTLDYPIIDLIDMGGWDLQKVLRLLRKSNAALMEWLQSPIIYREAESIAQRIREMLPLYYSPPAALYHYLSMAKGTYNDHLQGQNVQLKKYFYALRPLLAVKWVEKCSGPVPMEFGRMLDRFIPNGSLRNEINALLRRKQQVEEDDNTPAIPMLNTFIESELVRMDALRIPHTEQKPDVEELNRLFRLSLELFNR